MMANPPGDGPSRLERLEAEFLAATRAPEIVAIAGRAPSSKAAIPQIMEAFSITEEQAVIVLDTQFRIVTQGARQRIEQELAALRPAGD